MRRNVPCRARVVDRRPRRAIWVRRAEEQADDRRDTRNRTAGPCPGESPQGEGGKGGYPAGQPGHAGQLRLLVDAALSERVPFGQAGDRHSELEMAAAVAADHPVETALHQRRELQADLEPREGRKPPHDHHQGPDIGDCRADGGGAWRGRDGRLLYALWQSLDRLEGASDGGGGMREDPVLPALPPLRRGDLGHGERCLLCRADA